MPDHCQTTTKEHFYEWYKHKKNQCCYNSLILENSIEVTKIKIMEWKSGEEWSYEWCSYYTTVEYQIVTDEEPGNWNWMLKYYNGISFAVKKSFVFASAT